jgi:hypothetical protein
MNELQQARVKSLVLKYKNAKPEEQIKIIESLVELSGELNFEFLLELSLRSFYLGDDEKSQFFLRKAKKKEPMSNNVLRLELFLSCSVRDRGARDLCEKLLRAYPQDRWALEMKRKIERDELSSIELPPLSFSPWTEGEGES